VYSCAYWADGKDDTLARAQLRKLDHFAHHLGAAGASVLDVGCGWGALLDRFVRRHGAAGGIGLTLSPAQVRSAAGREVPGVDIRLEHWADHDPDALYDAITCIEATEHFASDEMDADAKVDVYREFFDRCAAWLRPGGRVGLQLICLDAVGHAGSRAGRGPLSELIRTTIFPESMPASLGELVLGWETHFRVADFLDHSAHYVRTFREWSLAERAVRPRVRELVGEATAREFERYFAVGEAVFRLREQALYRVILTKRPEPKKWALRLRPSDVEGAPVTTAGASPVAVASHYDVSNDFYRLWLGPTMMYSSGAWPPETVDLQDAQARKIDAFASWTAVPAGGRVLDVGCGWGYALHRLVERHDVGQAVGLTISPAQHDEPVGPPTERIDLRLERWEDHRPGRPYDAVVTFGAFEHFAPDGSTGPQRVAAYRRFFERCHDWLAPGGRLGMETIAHDDAPDTDAPLGRGALGDVVLAIYPESLCPHLSEIVLGFEPWFEVEVLQAAGADFARTMQHWIRNLRDHEVEAVAAVGEEVTRRFWRYLVSSDVQFRLGAITNCRIVLHRRAAPRW
jgi:cyclopropane-fatty-acyl-phospholipid synthase